MKKQQLAINTASIKFEAFEECLKVCSLAGFNNIEFVIPQIKNYMDKGYKVKDIRKLLEEYSLHCIGGLECRIKCFADEDERRVNHELLKNNVRLLSELGGSVMIVGTDGNSSYDCDPIDRIADVAGGVAEQMKKYGVTLCIEVNWSPVVRSIRTAVDIAKRSGSSNLGVLFDTAHYHCTSSRFEHLTFNNVAEIKHVHVSDMNNKSGELSHCNEDRTLPGQGCLDLKAIFRKIEEHGYKGYFSIEVFGKELWALPPEEAARKMYDSLVSYCD